MTMIVPV